MVPRLDELAKRDTNFRYQAILPLTDFKALCAASYDIQSIIKTIFTQKILILNNKSPHEKPELTVQITPEDIKQIELFDYQLGLKQVKAQFQDQTLFENSLTALIYDNRFQLHFGKIDSLLPDWDKDSADLTLRKASKSETFVNALWHFLPLQTRLQRGVSTGLPEPKDAMYKACQATNVAAIALQFQNSTSVKEASEQALNSIDTNAKDFRAIKTHYVKPLLTAIEANDIASVLELQKNYMVENSKISQPHEEKVQATATASKKSSQSDVHSNQSKGYHAFFKWLPMGIIAFLSLTILFLLINQNPSNPYNDTQIAKWQQSHKELAEIKAVIADQIADWQRSHKELIEIKAIIADQTPWTSVDALITDWRTQTQELARIKQVANKWQKTHQDLLADIKNEFADKKDSEWTSKPIISLIKNLKSESETTNQQLMLLQALLLQNWNETENQIKMLRNTNAVIATQANKLVENIQTWQENSAAYTTQSEKQEKLQKKYDAMQLLLNALIEKNWEEVEQHLPSVNNQKLIAFVDNLKTLTEQIEEYDDFKEEAARLQSIEKELNLTKLTLQETQRELNNVKTNYSNTLAHLEIKKGELEKANQQVNDLSNQIKAKDNELNQLNTELDAIAQIRTNANKLAKQAKASIDANALNDSKNLLE